MKFFIAVILFSFVAKAEMAESLSRGAYFGNPYAGIYGGMPVSKKFACNVNLNLALQNNTLFSKSPSPITVDFAGKLVVDQKRVQEFKKDGDDIVVVYKDIMGDMSGATVEINRKISIKTENGQITKVVRHEDLEIQKKLNAKFKDDYKKNFGIDMSQMPTLKSTEMTFKPTEDGCDVQQTMMLIEKDKKEEKHVIYDREFCKSIEPFINNIGRQNAQSCAMMLGNVENNYHARADQLKSENKFFVSGAVGVPLNKPQIGSADFFKNHSLSAMITSCVMAEDPYMAYPGGGMNNGMFGGNNGFGMKGNKAGVIPPTPTLSPNLGTK